MASPPTTSYGVGVMMMDVEGRNSDAFHRVVEQAVATFEQTLTVDLHLRVDLFAFEGPHLTPAAGAYAPLDFLALAFSEKVERKLPFLLVVTEVDLAASTLAYTLALPSRLTNVGIVSMKRLDPAFWGEDADPERTARRLAALLLHTFGHLLNLPHEDAPDNVMHDLGEAHDLDAMTTLTAEQKAWLLRALPREAHERVSVRRGWGPRLAFVLRTLVADARSIAAGIAQANPFRLATRLPTMIAAALSVVIVLFFSPEMWDVASTVELYQLVLFAAISVASATVVLYRAFALGAVLNRERLLAESTVVTAATTGLSLALTLLLLYTLFVGLLYLGTVTIFPRQLMETWPTVDPAVRVLDHLKLSLFLAALGILAGSLGGRADSRDLVRSVLFITEES